MSRTSTAWTGLVTAAGADPTDPTPLPADPDAPDASVIASDNWAGWVDEADTSVELRYVTATFTVPTVSCSSANQHVGFWVGLDGFKPNKTVEQVGVEVNCVNGSNGWAPVYDSFWEMYPNGPTENAGVSAGDSITASVYYNSSTSLYNLVLNDASTETPDINVNESCPSGSTCPNKSAEVIVEDPFGAVPNGMYLSDFGSVNFSDVGVTSRDGTHGFLASNSLWGANEVIMYSDGYSDGTLMAKPSERLDGNSYFSVTWHSNG